MHNTSKESLRGTPDSDELDLDFDAFRKEGGKVDARPATRQKFDPVKRALMQQLQREVEAEIATAEERVRQRSGSKFDGIRITARVQASVKSPEGTAKAYNEIICRILTPSGAAGTQTAIRNAVQAKFPAIAIPRDWNKPLPAWSKTKLLNQIRSAGVPFSTIALQPRISLAQLHRLAAAALEKQKVGALTFTAEVCVADAKVLVNGTPFRITSNLSGGKDYRYVRLGIDALLTSLQAGKSTS